MAAEKILVWLPSPMGDAILSTPALGAIRHRFSSCSIGFIANSVVQSAIKPTDFADFWIEHDDSNPFKTASRLKQHSFDCAVLFKNSFGSALTAFLAGIPRRIGYARDGRGMLLTEKLHPRKLSLLRYKPLSMIDYYSAISSWLGAQITGRIPRISVDSRSCDSAAQKLGSIIDGSDPLVVLVPGGAFGPSKMWPCQRFSALADKLIDKYHARVVVSVSPAPAERDIAKKICAHSSGELVNLGEFDFSISELKALISRADLVISNDTGPRHIAIALGRKIVTLFGPNNPAWTETGYSNEIKIIGDAPCMPCDKPVCKKNDHLCMRSITTERVFGAAEQLLESSVVS